MDERPGKLLALVLGSRMKMSLVTNWLLLWALSLSLTLSVCVCVCVCLDASMCLYTQGMPVIWDQWPPWVTLA